MTIDDLPIIEITKRLPLKVVERVEITYRGGVTLMAYVAGKTEDGRIIYDTAAIKRDGEMFIERLNMQTAPIDEISTYISIRPYLRSVK